MPEPLKDTPPIDIAALRLLAGEAIEIASKATRGPWDCEVDGWPVRNIEGGSVPWWCERIDESEGNPYRPYFVSLETLHFTAESRTLVPELAAHVLRLADELERVRSLIDVLGDNGRGERALAAAVEVGESYGSSAASFVQGWLEAAEAMEGG